MWNKGEPPARYENIRKVLVEIDFKKYNRFYNANKHKCIFLKFKRHEFNQKTK